MKLKISVLILALMLSGCTATLYTPTLTEISSGPQGDMHLPSDASLWVYCETLMSKFMQRVDLDAGIDFGGNVADAGLSAGAGFVALASRSAAGVSPVVAYLAGAEGILRRLMGIANPIVRANALSGGVRSLRMARAQYITELTSGGNAEISGTTLTPAGARFLNSIEGSVNVVIALLQGSWPTLPEQMMAGSVVIAPVPGGGVKLQSLIPLPMKGSGQ